MTDEVVYEAKDLRTYQRQASKSARGEAKSEDAERDSEAFVADLLARRSLRDRRIWGEKCLEAERKFGHRSARLYPLIGVAGGVMTPSGQGTLFNVRSDGCQILLTRGRKTGRRQTGEKYRPLIEFPVEAIKPYGTTLIGRGAR